MHTQLRLASIFSDHMVLCRNRNIRIFGEAETGREIVVSIHDHTASCAAVKSKFEAVLPPMPHGGPYILTVSDGESTLTFADIFIGDVYFAGGQSNMEWPLEQSENGPELVKTLGNPMIRYVNFPHNAWLDKNALRHERNMRWKVLEPCRCAYCAHA